MSDPAKFRQHCQKLANVLTNEIKGEFQKATDDLARLKFLYPIAVELNIEADVGARKDYQRSESLKTSGNKLFQNRNFFLAVNVYNEALLRCPQDTPEGEKLRDILIANRSAVFFESKHFRKVLRDVKFLTVYGRHPTPHKLYFRAGKASEGLKLYTSALSYYAQAEESLNSNSEIKEDDKKKQLSEIQAKIKVVKAKKIKDASYALEYGISEVKTKNITYPALSAKVAVKSSAETGRYVVAKEDIRAGEIIAAENPYACVVSGDTFRTNCTNCLLSTDQPITCERCCQACFCCFECKEAASAFHKNECQLLSSLFDIGVSVNCLMAFRMITQRSLSEILAEAEDLVKERNVVIYKTNDYYNVHNLVSHADRRNREEFIHYTFMATYLLRLLKTTDYFGKPTSEATLTEDEAYIGSLLLKNLQILQFNAHEISELENVIDESGQVTGYRSGSVGAGLYPTLALFNHSCDPSVIRYNVGNVMVLRAIKPIKMNECVYENYGPLFTSDSLNSRQCKLRESYWFDCKCTPCLEDWPLFQDIDSNVLRIRCDCGAVIMANKDLDNPFLNCPKCKKEKNIFPMLGALIPLEMKSAKMEEFFTALMYKEASDVIVDMLQIYTKNLVPPLTDMILLQQRLKTCMIHLGNRKFNYIMFAESMETRMEKLMT